MDGLSRPRNLETGLAVLAQVGMLVEDLRWMDRDTPDDLPSYMSESWLSDPETREELAQALEWQARLHSDLLRDSLPDLDADPWRADYAVEGDDIYGIIADDNPAERLSAALASQPTNPMQELVDEGVIGESMAVATQRNLRAVRREQNQLNLEMFGTPHPPRPPPEPVSLPEFNELATEIPLAPRPAPAASSRRRKKPAAFANIALRIPRAPSPNPVTPVVPNPVRPASHGKRKRAPPREKSGRLDRDSEEERSAKRRKAAISLTRSRRTQDSERGHALPPQRKTRSQTLAERWDFYTQDGAEHVQGLEDDARGGDGPPDARYSSLEPVSWAVSGVSESELDYAEYPDSRTSHIRSAGSSVRKSRRAQPVEFTPGPSESEGSGYPNDECCDQDGAEKAQGLESDARSLPDARYSSLEPVSWAVSGVSESELDYTEYPESRTSHIRSAGSAVRKPRRAQPVEFTPGPSESEGPGPSTHRPPLRPRPRPRPRKHTGGGAPAGPSTNF